MVRVSSSHRRWAQPALSILLPLRLLDPELPEGTKTLTLPNNDKIRILAVSVAEENPELTQAQPLYDMLSRTEPPNAAFSPTGSSK